MKKVFAFLFSLVSLCAQAQSEFTVTHGVGGLSDIITRYLAKELPVTYPVVNRPGAGGKIAMNHIIAENGFMLATTTQFYVTNIINYPEINPHKEITIVQPIGIIPMVLVCHNSTGIKTYKDFVNSTKDLTFGIGAIGTSDHIATAILIQKTKVSGIVVPYSQGSVQSFRDLLGGHINCVFSNLATVKPHRNNPSLNFILASHETGLGIPTWKSVFAETFPYQSYLAIVVPAKMPVAMKNKIKTEFQQAVKKPNFNEGLKSLGVFPATDTDEIPKIFYESERLLRYIKAHNLNVSG